MICRPAFTLCVALALVGCAGGDGKDTTTDAGSASDTDTDTDTDADSDTDVDSDTDTDTGIDSGLVDADTDGHPASTDCDDTDATIYPGAVELPYDGIDQDCDTFDLVDQDGDGVPGVDYNVWQPTAQADWPSDAVQYQVDCLDDGSIPGVDPATVYPVGGKRPYPVDVPYDGVDTDCDAWNDFDADADGFNVSADVLPTVEADFDAFVAAFHYESLVAGWGAVNPDVPMSEPGAGDCVDDDRDVHPQALERLGDAIDGDCDGDEDGFVLQTLGLSDTSMAWHRPTPPVVATLDHVTAVIVASEAYQEGAGPLEEQVGLALPLVGDGVPHPSAAPYRWRLANTLLPLAPAIDVVQSDACDPGVATVAAAYEVSSSSIAYLGHWRLEIVADSVVSTYTTLAPADVAALPDDVEVLYDRACEPVVIGCADDPVPNLHVTHGSEPLPNLADVQSQALGGASCYPLGPVNGAGQVVVASCIDGQGCDEVTVGLDPKGGDPVIASVDGAPYADVSAGSFHPGADDAFDVIIEHHAGGAQGVTAVIDGYPVSFHNDVAVVAADATGRGDEVVVVALVDDAVAPLRITHLAAGGLTQAALPLAPPAATPDAVPVGVGITLEGDRIAIAVSMHDPTSTTSDLRDAVVWGFVATP